MPLILPGNVAAATASTAYSVANSCRFDGTVGSLLERTSPSDSATNEKIATMSFWMKLGAGSITPSASKYIFYNNNASTSPGYFQVQITTDGQMIFVASQYGGFELKPTRKFRDPSAWYHFCLQHDSTPSTPSASSMRLWINGVLQTDFVTERYPAQNNTCNFTQASIYTPIGTYADSYASFDGYLAEFMVVDGQSLAADQFGEFDSDSPGIWKPIDISGITLGAQGYYLDFEDSSAMGNDAGGGADFTASNIAATDQCTDTPTNNFATLNPLWRSSFDNDGTYSEGNLGRSFTSANSDRGYGFSTMGVTAGKWYWEIKIPTVARTKCGVGDATKIASFTGAFYSESTSYGMEVGTDGSISENGTTTDPFAASLSDDDIVMFALDMDNHRCWYGINGTWQDSGDPTSGATGTGDITTKISDQTHINTGEFIFPFVYKVSTSGQGDFQCNFGNPPFTLSSAVADGNGYGAFEYAPPSGFLALCTKNLGSDGG